MTEAPSTSEFEIDHPDIFAQFRLTNRQEILFYLNLLVQRRALLSAHVNGGRHFFLTSIIAVNTMTGEIFLDPPNIEESYAEAITARQTTLLTTLDRVKIQLRLGVFSPTTCDGQEALAAALPTELLRLQRREFFRLEPPVTAPIICQVAATTPENPLQVLDLHLSDISVGGLCLVAKPEMAALFPRDALFQHCRLEFPDEGVIRVNLRVHKAVNFSTHEGHHTLRVGCEFVDLPATAMAFIQRYITRIERERKARGWGLS
ncbi:MAG: flagellar brake protein [Azonexus sp.]|jgi:c-di-GMP-binding flagellar brake protein YcgR|nr:flagellar brake protein [Azonexus sp.]